MNKEAECIRTVANWSISDKAFAYDHDTFDKKKLLEAMPAASPKMEALFKKINELDAVDMKKYGVHFKHMIFTDIKSSAYGAKLLAAGFAAKGYNPSYDSKYNLDVDKLKKTPGHNFALLCSTTLYQKPIGARFRKHLLDIFNKRPENIHGDLIRFMILDQGYKEGIDLYDIKYVHLFEPLITVSDEKQAIGRGTRLCGQKGLSFDPNRGWPLYVFRYEVGIPEELHDKLKSARMFELFLQHSGINTRKLVFSNTLEKMCIYGAVDHDLTRNVHEFSIDENDEPSTIGLRSLLGLVSGGAKKGHKHRVNAKTFLQMREYVKERFGKYTWPKAELENQCVKHGGADIVSFNDTQNFVRMFFQPHSSYKGLLLWHSTGTGKTCSAVATSSTSWEKHGYSILWVTRHTLKPDIWKNMYRQVCSLVIRDQIRKGKDIPEDAIKTPMRYASKLWMPPISYKQFSNLLAGKNELYHEMVRRNGPEDPLKKTFIIIDEAHKLFSVDVPPSERPDVDLIYKSILDSYDKSKKDSCRVLLMTATPYTSDPMQLIKLMNLMRPREEHIAEEFTDFSAKYLDPTGKFSKEGTMKFLNDITGYISYLNREKDARQFSYPVYENIVVPMSRSDRKTREAEVNHLGQQIQYLESGIQQGKEAVKKVKQRVKADKARMNKECMKLPKSIQRKGCKEQINIRMTKFEHGLLDELEQRMEGDQTRLGDMKEKMRTIKRQLKDKKADYSQEAALDSRCDLKH
jgi:hypothetical protein